MSSEWDAARFFKSRGSGDHGCVEVAFHGGQVGVRDTKDHGRGPVLAFTAHDWDAFMAGAKAGKFDLGGPLDDQPPGGVAGAVILELGGTP